VARAPATRLYAGPAGIGACARNRANLTRRLRSAG
jgi:hypothetical protein